MATARTSVLVAQLFGNGSECFFAARENDQLGSMRRERPRASGADASRRAGDDYRFVSEGVCFHLGRLS